MRIACVYIPSFPLQSAVAGSPDQGSAGSIAIVSGAQIGSPVVVACSRAAWLAGVRPGTTATVARSIDPELQCIVADVAAERALLRSVADGLLGLAPRVELGGEPRGQHHVMYAELPSGRRGTWFGTKVRELLALFGLRGRIGIADDRFTAFVAASNGAREDEDAVVCVPRGGSAAYLAPQPLSLLQLGPEVLHMLEALGVKTLGQFAELPPPSVMRPDRGGWDADFQALARGDGGADLTPYTPTGPIAERVQLATASDAAGAPSVGAAVEQLAQRLAARLAGRGARDTGVELMVRLTGATTLPALRSVLVPDADAASLGDAIGRALGGNVWTTIETIARPETAAPVMAQAPSAGEPVRHEVEPIAPLVLLPSPTAYGRTGERVEHRRTRRGKQRPRIGTGQARLFAGD